jgi:hypothetical protein
MDRKILICPLKFHYSNTATASVAVDDEEGGRGGDMINVVKKDTIKKIIIMMPNLRMLNMSIHLGLEGVYCKTGMRRQRRCLNGLPPLCK